MLGQELFEVSLLAGFFLSVAAFVLIYISFFATWIRFYNYVKKNHSARFTWLSSMQLLGYEYAGFGSPVRMIRYMFSNLDDENQIVREAKVKIKTRLKYMLFCLLVAAIFLLLFASRER